MAAASAMSLRMQMVTHLGTLNKPIEGTGAGETYRWLARATAPFVPAERKGRSYDHTTLAKWLHDKGTSASLEGTMNRWKSAGMPEPAGASADQEVADMAGPSNVMELSPVHTPDTQRDPTPPLADIVVLKEEMPIVHMFLMPEDLTRIVTWATRAMMTGQKSDNILPRMGEPPGKESNDGTEGYVYILSEVYQGAPTGFVKVGRVNNETGGVPTGTTRFNPRPLRCVASFRVYNTMGVEHESHLALGTWHHTGEWFLLPADKPDAMYTVILTVAAIAARTNHRDRTLGRKRIVVGSSMDSTAGGC